jgi:hypothetical protein
MEADDGVDIQVEGEGEYIPKNEDPAFVTGLFSSGTVHSSSYWKYMRHEYRLL